MPKKRHQQQLASHQNELLYYLVHLKIGHRLNTEEQTAKQNGVFFLKTKNKIVSGQ